MAKQGRPFGSGSRYLPKYCRLILEYFEKAANQGVRELAPITVEQAATEQIGARGKKKKTGFLKTEVRRICAELPTIQGFAISIGIPSTTVKGWPKDHPEFADAYARAKDIQFKLLIDRGLTKQYDPQAFQFVAKNITDMKDTHTLAGDPEAPIAARLVLVDAGDDKPTA